MLTEDYEKKRRLLIEENLKEGVESAAEFCGLKYYKAKTFNYSSRIVFQNEKGIGEKDK